MSSYYEAFEPMETAVGAPLQPFGWSSQAEQDAPADPLGQSMKRLTGVTPGVTAASPVVDPGLQRSPLAREEITAPVVSIRAMGGDQLRRSSMGRHPPRQDSKSGGRKPVGVRFPLPAPITLGISTMLPALPLPSSGLTVADFVAVVNRDKPSRRWSRRAASFRGRAGLRSTTCSGWQPPPPSSPGCSRGASTRSRRPRGRPAPAISRGSVRTSERTSCGAPSGRIRFFRGPRPSHTGRLLQSSDDRRPTRARPRAAAPHGYRVEARDLPDLARVAARGPIYRRA